MIPVKDGDPVRVRLARGEAGFLLAHLALWFHEAVEPLNTQRQLDDWGWAVRPIRGSTVMSNHASGTAVDLNAILHPMGVPTASTFTAAQIARVHRRLRHYRGMIRWGGDYVNRPDGMHFEIDRGHDQVKAYVREHVHDTLRGHRIREANPVLP